MKSPVVFTSHVRIVLGLMMGLLALATPGWAANSQDAGEIQANTTLPFQVQRVTTLDTPWALAFLPDGRMLITERPGRMLLLTQSGTQTIIQGMPAVYYRGQNGLLDVAIPPDFDRDSQIYFTYVAPERDGGALTLERGRLIIAEGHASLQDLKVLWQQHPASRGGQPGGIIAFAPDGRHLFLSVGDRMEPESAQNPRSARGKILRMTLDGSVPHHNPWAEDTGVRALSWSIGHRNPYGLAFAPDGQLWEDEMGPKGGDELNLILSGRNYGWPIVSNGDNYDGTPIPRHRTHPEFQTPAVYWTPVIAPSSLAFYHGSLFPQWQGSALIGGLISRGLVRIAFGPNNTARQVDRWSLGARIRDVAIAPDGAIWVIEDGQQAGLLRLTPR